MHTSPSLVGIFFKQSYSEIHNPQDSPKLVKSKPAWGKFYYAMGFQVFRFPTKNTEFYLLSHKPISITVSLKFKIKFTFAAKLPLQITNLSAHAVASHNLRLRNTLNPIVDFIHNVVILIIILIFIMFCPLIFQAYLKIIHGVIVTLVRVFSRLDLIEYHCFTFYNHENSDHRTRYATKFLFCLRKYLSWQIKINRFQTKWRNKEVFRFLFFINFLFWRKCRKENYFSPQSQKKLEFQLFHR